MSTPAMQMCGGGGTLVGGSGAGGMIRLPLLIPCKLPAMLAPPLCRCLRLELRPAAPREKGV